MSTGTALPKRTRIKVDQRDEIRAWYRDTARKLPRKVVADVRWLLDQLDALDLHAKELTRLDNICNGLAKLTNEQASVIHKLKRALLLADAIIERESEVQTERAIDEHAERLRAYRVAKTELPDGEKR